MSYLIAFLVSMHLSPIVLASKEETKNYTIDHVVIAVNDLEAARATFRSMGFTIKRGTKHANSIENAHIKFSDGTALELISASEPQDELTEGYLKLQSYGDGFAYLCLKMEHEQQTSAILSKFNTKSSQSSYYQTVTFPEESNISYLFFLKYLNPLKEDIEFVSHENGTLGLRSIALLKSDFAIEKQVFETLGSIEGADHFALGNHLIEMKKGASSVSGRPTVSIKMMVADIHETMERLPKGIPFEFSGNTLIRIPRMYCHGVELVFEQK